MEGATLFADSGIVTIVGPEGVEVLRHSLSQVLAIEYSFLEESIYKRPEISFTFGDGSGYVIQPMDDTKETVERLVMELGSFREWIETWKLESQNSLGSQKSSIPELQMNTSAKISEDPLSNLSPKLTIGTIALVVFIIIAVLGYMFVKDQREIDRGNKPVYGRLNR